MIVILPYTADWPADFAARASALRAALGDLALRIDHIGSTSVPGLAAKDIIDIQVTVAAFAPEITQALASLGYLHRTDLAEDHCPPHAPTDAAQWEKQVYKHPGGPRTVNLHVRLQGRANQRYALLFRDYLRTHPGAAGAYALIKQQLARYHPEDWDAYYDIKDPACDLIWQGAEEWALRVGWLPGPSDG